MLFSTPIVNLSNKTDFMNKASTIADKRLFFSPSLRGVCPFFVSLKWFGERFMKFKDKIKIYPNHILARLE